MCRRRQVRDANSIESNLCAGGLVILVSRKSYITPYVGTRTYNITQEFDIDIDIAIAIAVASDHIKK